MQVTSHPLAQGLHSVERTERAQESPTLRGHRITYIESDVLVRVPLGRMILRIAKVMALVLVTLGFALLSQSFRNEWRNAFSLNEVKRKQVPVMNELTYIVPAANFSQPKEGDEPYEFRQKIFQETKQAYENGYLLSGNPVTIDNAPMLMGSRVYQELPPLPPVDSPFHTLFTLEVDDTFNVLLRMKCEGKNPAGINMANAFKRGGGVERGCPAQEEALSRRSNFMAIENHPQAGKAVLGEGGIYSPHVVVFREDDKKGYAFMESPQEVALLSVAAFDLRKTSSDRIKLGLSGTASYTFEQLRNHQGFVNGTKNKIRNMLRAAAIHGHEHLVLGALGCGAFHNPPKLIATLFKEVFEEIEFRGCFEHVAFAVLEARESDRENVAAFREMCEHLNENINLLP